MEYAQSYACTAPWVKSNTPTNKYSSATKWTDMREWSKFIDNRFL